MTTNQQTKIITMPTSDVNDEQTALCLTNTILGSGMFGCVLYGFEKKDPTNMFAVKVISRKNVDSNKIALNQMLREIQLMQKIKSPNVVSLKTHTKTQNTYYLSMELLNGGDLQNYVKQRGGYLCEHEARLILRQIVKGLTACKLENVMHRDLKLANIMVHFGELR